MEIYVSTSKILCDLNKEFHQYQPPAEKIPFDVNNKYNVFLNFRGKDVRTTFVDHLYEALSGAGLRVFLDSEELAKGKEIESSLKKAIQSSDIFIPIFSKNYAESTWCLKEAAQMCRCNGFIIPLFYDVEPSDVRYPQRKGGLFEGAFKKHYTHSDRQDEKTIQEWNNALHQISSLSGWTRADELGSVGLGSLVEKKFNVYFVYHAADEREIFMGDKYKYLRTGSLRLCRDSEDNASSDIREAFGSSDILVPVFSKNFVSSIVCMRNHVAMNYSNGLVIPLVLRTYTWPYCYKYFKTMRKLNYQSL